MPGMDEEPLAIRIARRKAAEQQVRAKFPALIEGSSGWHRAVENRVRRIR